LLHPRARVEVESFKCQRAAKNAIFPAAQLESAIQRRREVKEQLLKGRVGWPGWILKFHSRRRLQNYHDAAQALVVSGAHIEMIHTWQT
jgi:hypothetical protein